MWMMCTVYFRDRKWVESPCVWASLSFIWLSHKLSNSCQLTTVQEGSSLQDACFMQGMVESLLEGESLGTKLSLIYTLHVLSPSSLLYFTCFSIYASHVCRRSWSWGLPNPATDPAQASPGRDAPRDDTGGHPGHVNLLHQCAQVWNRDSLFSWPPYSTYTACYTDHEFGLVGCVWNLMLWHNSILLPFSLVFSMNCWCQYNVHVYAVFIASLTSLLSP